MVVYCRDFVWTTYKEAIDVAVDLAGVEQSETVPGTIRICPRRNGITVFLLSGGTGDDVVGGQTVGQLLHTVADAENRDAGLEPRGVNWDKLIVCADGYNIGMSSTVGSHVLVDAVGTAAQDDTDGLPAEVGSLLGAGQEFGIDVELSHTTDEEVGELRAGRKQRVLAYMDTRHDDEEKKISRGVGSPKVKHEDGVVELVRLSLGVGGRHDGRFMQKMTGLSGIMVEED